MPVWTLTYLQDSNSFYSKDLYWATSILYCLEIGAEQCFLGRAHSGGWEASCRSGDNYFRISKPEEINGGPDLKLTLLSIFEQDALWHYTNTNDSIGHCAASVYDEIVDMWLWQPQEHPDNLMFHLIYNKSLVIELVKKFIASYK